VVRCRATAGDATLFAPFWFSTEQHGDFHRQVRDGATSLSGSRDYASSIVRVPVRVSRRACTPRERDDQPLLGHRANLRLEPHRCGHMPGAKPLDNQTSQYQTFVASLLLPQFRIAHS